MVVGMAAGAGGGEVAETEVEKEAVTAEVREEERAAGSAGVREAKGAVQAAASEGNMVGEMAVARVVGMVEGSAAG